MYTLCTQVYTFVLFCGGVARRVAEYCSHWIRSWRSRTLFELSDLDSLVVAPTASPGTEPFHSLVYFRPVEEKRKGRQPWNT